jgi:hypothetical protein
VQIHPVHFLPAHERHEAPNHNICTADSFRDIHDQADCVTHTNTICLVMKQLVSWSCLDEGAAPARECRLLDGIATQWHRPACQARKCHIIFIQSVMLSMRLCQYALVQCPSRALRFPCVSCEYVPVQCPSSTISFAGKGSNICRKSDGIICSEHLFNTAAIQSGPAICGKQRGIVEFSGNGIAALSCVKCAFLGILLNFPPAMLKFFGAALKLAGVICFDQQLNARFTTCIGDRLKLIQSPIPCCEVVNMQMHTNHAKTSAISASSIAVCVRNRWGLGENRGDLLTREPCRQRQACRLKTA